MNANTLYRRSLTAGACALAIGSLAWAAAPGLSKLPPFLQKWAKVVVKSATGVPQSPPADDARGSGSLEIAEFSQDCAPEMTMPPLGPVAAVPALRVTACTCVRGSGSSSSVSCASVVDVVTLSERAAEKFWPGQNPIGRRFFRNAGTNSPVEVIGVARDVRTFGLTRVSPYLMYISINQESFRAMTVVVRSQGADPTTVIPAARKVVASIDPLLPMARLQTMTDVVGRSVTQPRLISSLTVLFGGLAGLLAIVGVYGVMAFNVRRARREFGIRLALGADPAAVRRLVVSRGLILGSVGVAVGAAGGLLLTRTLQSLLNDVKPTDPAVFVGTGVTLLLVCVAAGFVPALHASRTDPLIVLRTE